MSARASDGCVNGYVNLRAGPGPATRDLMTLQPGAAVAVHGCINGWSGCDVGAQGERGRVDGGYLQYPYGNRRGVLSDCGFQAEPDPAHWPRGARRLRSERAFRHAGCRVTPAGGSATPVAG